MSKVKLEVGMRMKCAMYGEGEVVSLSKNKAFSIRICFRGDNLEDYLEDGKYLHDRITKLKLLNIPFAEGMEVECDIYGSGVVKTVLPNEEALLDCFNIEVEFTNGVIETYTLDGRINLHANQTLFPKFTI